MLNEDCPCYIKGKFRIKQFPKRSIYLPETDLQPWEKVYVDGYGGRSYWSQRSEAQRKDLFSTTQ